MGKKDVHEEASDAHDAITKSLDEIRSELKKIQGQQGGGGRSRLRMLLGLVALVGIAAAVTVGQRFTGARRDDEWG